MPIRPPAGNMYTWITGQWNPVKGKCLHSCTYCYAARYGNQKPIHLDERELKTNLGNNEFLFVCSGCDLFADDIPSAWITRVLEYAKKFNDNKYLFQSKNPKRMAEFLNTSWREQAVVCTTIETNRWYPEIMQNAPHPLVRAFHLAQMIWLPRYVTVEPIMDFDLDDMVSALHSLYPKQVNIGADSGGNHLPEPSREKILALIAALEKFTIINQKSNLARLLR